MEIYFRHIVDDWHCHHHPSSSPIQLASFHVVCATILFVFVANATHTSNQFNRQSISDLYGFRHSSFTQKMGDVEMLDAKLALSCWAHNEFLAMISTIQHIHQLMAHEMSSRHFPWIAEFPSNPTKKIKCLLQFDPRKLSVSKRSQCTNYTMKRTAIDGFALHAMQFRCCVHCFDSSHWQFTSHSANLKRTPKRSFSTFLRINRLNKFNLFMRFRISELCVLSDNFRFCCVPLFVDACASTTHFSAKHIQKMVVNAFIGGRQLLARIHNFEYILITIILLLLLRRTTPSPLMMTMAVSATAAAII